MLRGRVTNYLLSRADIQHFKTLFETIPGLNSIYKITSQSLIDKQFPAHLFIETTRACNLACSCCPRMLKKTEKGHMDYNVYKKIIDEASSYGTRNFCLHMLGEPLLHPRIKDMVSYIKDKNSKHAILLTTNGYFLDEDKARCFLERGLDKIAFSLFSLDEEKNKVLTGKGSLERVFKNMRNSVVLKEKLKSRTKLYLRVIVSDMNKDEIPSFRKVAQDINIPLELRYETNFTGVVKNDWTTLNRSEKLKTRHPCYHIFYSPAVTWDGKVVICCVDYSYAEVLGDVQQTSIANIWTGKRMKELQDLHLRGEYDKIPACANCNVWANYPDIFFKFQKK